MSDSREMDGQVSKAPRASIVDRVPGSDEFVHTRTPHSPTHERPLTAGSVLWTLAQNRSIARARRWITPLGFELELQIWTGSYIEGQEDLCWTQLFPSEDALVEAALAKKQQLEASGWLEDIDSTPR